MCCLVKNTKEHNPTISKLASNSNKRNKPNEDNPNEDNPTSNLPSISNDKNTFSLFYLI